MSASVRLRIVCGAWTRACRVSTSGDASLYLHSVRMSADTARWERAPHPLFTNQADVINRLWAAMTPPVTSRLRAFVIKYDDSWR